MRSNTSRTTARSIAATESVSTSLVEGIPDHVFRIGEARENLSKIVIDVALDPSRTVVVGSRGIPTMICVSYQRFEPMLRRGNRTEKLALLVVDELLADAPPHIRAPAIRELSQLPMADLECLWGIETFPLTARQTANLKRMMAHPEALDRLAERARVAQVLSEARAAGLYDTLDHESGNVFDKVAE